MRVLKKRSTNLIVFKLLCVCLCVYIYTVEDKIISPYEM